MKDIFKTIIFCCLFFSVNSLSKTPDKTPENITLSSLDNGLADGMGVAGSFNSTGGFAYRRYFSSGIGITATAGGAFANQEVRVGLTGGMLFSLVHHHFPSFGLKESSVRVYMTVNGTGLYGRDTRTELSDPARNSFIFGVGVGPGVEYFLNRNFAFNIELPWMTKFRVREGDISFEGSAPVFGAGFTYYI